MPSSARAKMFIASCEENPPAKTSCPPAQPEGIGASPSKEPANRSRNFGFSVCDILMEQRTAKLKKVPLIVISGGNSRTVKLRQTDFSPIPNGQEAEVERSECSPSEHSLSPSSPKPEIARVETSNRQQREKPRLKFSIDRILADEPRVPIIDNSPDNAGEACRLSCTCAEEISPLPTLLNSRFSYRNSSSFDYPAHHSQLSLSDYNRHQLTSAFYSSNLLSSAYTSTPWSIHNQYAHHHHLLHPVATSVYPVAHLGSTNSIIESSRNYHHYPNHHHHGGLYVGNGDVSGSNSVGANSSSAVGVTSNSGKRKRSWSRAVFSNLQRKGLEKRFQIQKYITKPDRRQLAATLGLTDAQVKVWFQNRRMKWRHSKEAKEEMAKQSSGSVNKVTEADSRKVERPANINTTAEQHANSEKQSDTCLKNPEQT